MNICGDCKRYMGCSWERDFIPVPGWTAQPARMQVEKGRYIDTFEVAACPLFLPPGQEAQKTTPPVRFIHAVNLETKEVRLYDSPQAAARDGFHLRSVYRVLNGERNSHKGWKFMVKTPSEK